MSKDNFQSQLESMINSHNIENDSNTSDHFAQYIAECLKSYRRVVSNFDYFSHVVIHFKRKQSELD